MRAFSDKWRVMFVELELTIITTTREGKCRSRLQARTVAIFKTTLKCIIKLNYLIDVG